MKKTSLQMVDELGAISPHPPSTQVSRIKSRRPERLFLPRRWNHQGQPCSATAYRISRMISPKTKNIRCRIINDGITHYNFFAHLQEEDSMSGVSGLTDFSETRDSLGDSGIFR